MNKKNYQRIALTSELAGVFLFFMGAWIGSDVLQNGLYALAGIIAWNMALPTLGVGLLLFVAGRTLRAVLDNSPP